MSSTEEEYQDIPTEGLQIPGLVQNQDTVEQLAFNTSPVTPLPDNWSASFGPSSSPGLTNLSGPASNAGFANPATPLPAGTTGLALMQSQPAMSQALESGRAGINTGSLRPPLIIRGDSRKKRHSIRPPQGRRHVIGIAALMLLVIATGGMLLIVSPLGRDVGLGFNPLTSSNNLVKGGGPTNLNLVAQQATATAVVHQQTDGFDPTAGNGAPSYNTTGSPYPWPLGVCTYWANLRYHALTGHWVSWDGNAYQWAAGAREAGWNVSQTPHVPSIVVLMPGVQGASSYGHVAVVESMVNSTTVNTSNMNWYTNGGGWDIESYTDFTVGSGVYFVWY